MMSQTLTKNLAQTPYHVISTAFCVIVILSNIISAKMVPLPIFADFSIPAGLLTYPLTFLLSDLVVEIYGAQKARRMVYITLGMNILTFLVLQLALLVPGQTAEENAAFDAVLGLSGLRIFSSLTAYCLAQLAGIQAYALIKRWTGLKHLWARANGSTWLSQLIDTVSIDILFLYLGVGLPFGQVTLVIGFSFLYKAAFSIGLTPLFYLLVYLIKGRKRQEGDISVGQ